MFEHKWWRVAEKGPSIADELEMSAVRHYLVLFSLFDDWTRRLRNRC
ncbi:DUF3263 domain-containing protein [Rhodococcus sp. BP22]|nr:DUF3263 domain-containing protein [Rhodococcus sp. BP22]